MTLGAVEESAEPYDPSVPSLNTISRGGVPLVSMLALGHVCPTVKTVIDAKILWKSETSDYISGTDQRATGTSCICDRVCRK